MKVTLLMEVETVYRSRHLWRKKYSVEVEQSMKVTLLMEVETVYRSTDIYGGRNILWK